MEPQAQFIPCKEVAVSIYFKESAIVNIYINSEWFNEIVYVIVKDKCRPKPISEGLFRE